MRDGIAACELEDPVRHLEVLVILAPDVVDLARRALVQDELDPGAVILGVQPFTYLLPVAVHGQRLAFDGVGDEQRHELLRVLVRAVRVGAARDRGVDAVGAHIGEHLQIATCLGRAVRAGRQQRIVLDCTAAAREVAVDLVGGDLHVACAGLARPFEQTDGAEHVGPHELLGAEDRPVDMRLGGEVHDRLTSGARLGDGRRVGDVADDELVLDACEVRPISRVRQLVEHDDLVTLGCEPPDEVRPDEAGTAGDEHAHRHRVAAKPVRSALPYASSRAARGTLAARHASAAARVHHARCARPSTPGGELSRPAPAS